MKTKTLLLAAMAMIAFHMQAQTDYSKYLNKAMDKLEEGDCESSLKLYNVYKELTGKSAPSVEVLINDCLENNDEKDNDNKVYELGDKIVVGQDTFTVVYTRDNGQHGLAVVSRGWRALINNYAIYITQKGIPTLDELKLIYANRDKVRLYDIYWTCTKESSSNFYTIDFSTGKQSSAIYSYPDAVVLRIHRF